MTLPRIRGRASGASVGAINGGDAGGPGRANVGAINGGDAGASAGSIGSSGSVGSVGSSGSAGSGSLAGGPAPRTGLAMIVIMAGVLMTAIDTTIVVLALPEIQRSLDVALSGVVWVIISFLLVITLLATQVGRLGDMFGRVRMYQAGFAVFVVG